MLVETAYYVSIGEIRGYFFCLSHSLAMWAKKFKKIVKKDDSSKLLFTYLDKFFEEKSSFRQIFLFFQLFALFIKFLGHGAKICPQCCWNCTFRVSRNFWGKKISLAKTFFHCFLILTWKTANFCLKMDRFVKFLIYVSRRMSWGASCKKAIIFQDLLKFEPKLLDFSLQLPDRAI